jgi:hypothetical protein
MGYAILMREPDLQIDGWCIASGEAKHAADPETFEIPDRADRDSLEPGDVVKLIFYFNNTDPREQVASERMWVLVRQRIPGGYFGVLDNFPWSEPMNEEFHDGMELPFAAHHIIEIQAKNENTLKALEYPPRINWRVQSWKNMRKQRELSSTTSGPLFPGVREI